MEVKRYERKTRVALKKLRLGVIGAGSWVVASHLPNLAGRRDEVDFIAVCRHGAEALERIRADWGFEIASEDYREILDAGIDICVIASPGSLHYSHAKAALESGAHVLVEKPFTLQAADAWELVEVSKRVDRHVVVSFGWSYKPMVQTASNLMQTYGIGEVEQLTIQMASQNRELLSNTGTYPDAAETMLPEEQTWIDPQLSGGGYAQAALSHALALGLGLTGLRGAQVFAYMSSPLDAPVELHDAIAVRYSNGAIGTLVGGSNHREQSDNKHQLEMRAIGSKGQIHVDLERERIRLYRPGELDTEPAVATNDGRYDCDGPPHCLVDLALGRDVINRSPGELGARTVEILEAAYRSAETGMPADIDLNPAN